MRHALGSAFTVKELFYKFKTKRISLTCKDCARIFGDNHKTYAIAKIFRDCYRLVIEDIIENDVSFELPVGKCRTNISMKKIDRTNLARMRSKGFLLDVDFITSNFSAYRLVVNIYGNRAIPRDIPVYTDLKLK